MEEELCVLAQKLNYLILKSKDILRFLKDYKKFSSKELSSWRKMINFISIGGHYAKRYIFTQSFPKISMPTVLRQHMRLVIKVNRRFIRLLLHKIAEEYLIYYLRRITNIVNGGSSKSIPKPDETFEQRQVLLGHCAQIAVLLAAMTVTWMALKSSGCGFT